MKTGAGTRGSLNKVGQAIPSHRRFDGESKGCRAPGGGAKNRFASHLKALEKWIDEELENQNCIEPEECVVHFEFMLQQDVDELKALGDLTDSQQCRLAELEERLKKLKDGNYRKYQKKMIMMTLSIYISEATEGSEHRL